MNIKEFTRGWFIGNFQPSVLETKAFDVGVEKREKGEVNPPHYHKVCTEYVVIVTGKHRIGAEVFGEGDICIVKPLESRGYECLESGSFVVVKVPSGRGDKYVE